MWTTARRASRGIVAATLSAVLISTGATHVKAPALSPRLAKLPHVTVWVWERREDLRELDSTTTAVAYLDRTLVLDSRGLTVVPRRQPMLLPASTSLVQIAVVRLEVAEGTPLDDAQAEAVADAASEVARETHPAALQIDFDARRSERVWYAQVLRRIRARMPAGMPLSITALASWCSYDGDWLRDLPVDEAVPMLFRMEPDRLRAHTGPEASGDFKLRQPLCLTSVGISTRELWPRDLASRRIYIFPDHGWAADNLSETVRSLK
ncbi:MAG TPA: DUF3142 domain-containing protein [Acidobacteriaceae bacterium]|nr:DUF3142 domain-containing protein [Acidobacteriaceae bacterium]